MVLAPLHQGRPWIGKDELPGYEQDQDINEARKILEQAAALCAADMRRCCRPACEWAIGGTCRGSCHYHLPQANGRAHSGETEACSGTPPTRGSELGSAKCVEAHPALPLLTIRDRDGSPSDASAMSPRWAKVRLPKPCMPDGMTLRRYFLAIRSWSRKRSRGAVGTAQAPLPFVLGSSLH